MHEYSTKQLLEEIVRRSNALEYYSTRELIEEIVGRTTFAGVIFHATEEAKGRTMNVGWNINYRNITETDIAEMLQRGAEHFNQLAENDE